MSSADMALLIVAKELKSIIRNRGSILGDLWIAVAFGAFNVMLGADPSDLPNALFSVPLAVGVFVSYSFSSLVFLCEKREGIIETLLCTPLDLKSILFGKALSVAVPAYLFSLLAFSLVASLADLGGHSIVLPSAIIFIHMLVVVPFFTASVATLIGFLQFLLGMRENRVLGCVVPLLLLPYMYPPVRSLIHQEVGVVISWPDVVLCLAVSVLLLALMNIPSRCLNKERIVTSIPSS